MKTLSATAIATAMGLMLSLGALAQTPDAPPLPADASPQSVATTFKTDKAACGALAGNTKDICVVHAKGRQNVALAELAQRKAPSTTTTYRLSLARADAIYDESAERCDDLSGNAKGVCKKEAKAVHVSAKADATTVRKASDAQANASESTIKAKAKASDEVADAKLDARSDKREAQYELAKEKCGALASTAKDDCLAKAKSSWGPL